jgi:leucyl aminopeptidase
LPTFAPSSVAPEEAQAELLVLPVYEGPDAGPGVKEVSRVLGSDLIKICRQSNFKGKLGETLTVPSLGKIKPKVIVLVGVGKRAKVTSDTVRRAAGRVCGSVKGYSSVATTLASVARPPAASIQALVEGILLGSYSFDRYKTSEGKPKKKNEDRLSRVLILGRAADARAAKGAVSAGEIISESVCWARDLVNTPAGDMPPASMAAEARKMAKQTGISIKVWTPAELERGGMGGILGVGAGSEYPPRLIELSYSGGRASQPPVGLVGKGITFDSGGLSLKDAKNMEWMKADKGGASAMLAAMRAVALLKAKVNVVAAIPCAENMPSGSATKPGDVLHHRNGKTSEVLNTDAEGRLVMADALALLAEKKPAAIIDAATLTGACMVALGDQIYGVMGSDSSLVREILAAGKQTGEPGWELPLWDGYKSSIKSSVADVKNIGSRWGGAITAALFLKEFVGAVPWVHLDVAGTAFSEGAGGDYWPKGATGSPARTVIQFLLDRAGGARGSRR